MKLRLPPHVNGFIDRHGKPRYYLRKPDLPRAKLPGLPYTPQFMAAYEQAMAGVEVVQLIGESRTKSGTVNAAIVAYYNSTDTFQSLKPGTRKMRRAILERFRAEHGDKHIATLHTKAIVTMLSKLKPFAKHNWLKTLRGLMAFAVAEELCADDPTQGVKLAKVKTDGIATWTEDEIEQYEAAHPIGTRPRLALALLLYTAQRRSDVVRMGRQHIRNGMISVRQQKTGARLEIPMHAELQRVIDASPGEHLTFLTTEKGKPFAVAGFGNSFRLWCNAAKLPDHCSAHGLRKAACRRLAEAGCSVHEIAAISGHVSLSEVQRYTKAADQTRLAHRAMKAMQK